MKYKETILIILIIINVVLGITLGRNNKAVETRRK